MSPSAPFPCSPASSVVRDRVASLEAQTEETRITAPRTTPLTASLARRRAMGVRSPNRVTQAKDGTALVTTTTDRTNGGTASPPRGHSDPHDTSQDSSAPLSTTAAASHNRRSRLQREKSPSPTENPPKNQSSSQTLARTTGKAAMSSRRRNILLQQQQRSLATRRLLGLGDVPPSSPTSSSDATSSHLEATMRLGPAVSLLSHHNARGQKDRQQQTPHTTPTLLSSLTNSTDPAIVRNTEDAVKEDDSPAVHRKMDSIDHTVASTTTAARIGKMQRLRHMRVAQQQQQVTGAAMGRREREQRRQRLEASRRQSVSPEPRRAGQRTDMDATRKETSSDSHQYAAVNKSYPSSQDSHTDSIKEAGLTTFSTETQTQSSWRSATLADMPKSTPRHFYDVEEEKSSKSYTNHIPLAPSSSSDYDSSRSNRTPRHYAKTMLYGGSEHGDYAHHQQQNQDGDMHGTLPQDPSLSTSQLTPDVAAFFEHRSSTTTTETATHKLSQQTRKHQHHPLSYNSSNNTTATNIYSPKDHDDDTFDYSGQDERPLSSGNNHRHYPQHRRMTSTFDSTTPTLSPTTRHLASSNTLDEDDDEEEDYHDHHDDYGPDQFNQNFTSKTPFNCYSHGQHYPKRNSPRQPHVRYEHDVISQANDDGELDDGSVSFSQRTRQEQEAQLRKAAAAKAKAEMSSQGRNHSVMARLFVDTSCDKNDSLVESARKQLETPAVQTACGVAAAATAGCFLLGPVGLLVGAAAVGIGVGVLQIPPEQRENMQHKAYDACRGAQDHALNVSEFISNSCANTYSDSGIAEHMPVEVKQCCEAIDDEVTKVVHANRTPADDMDDDDLRENANSSHRGDASGSRGNAVSEGAGNGAGKRVDGGTSKHGDSKNSLSPSRFRDKKDKVACLRDGPVLPVSQIHALDPNSQPRAWLDILANAHSTHDEKIEAMEEISILSKDKLRARIFLEEGVLDSLIWILGRYFEKLEYDKKIHNWSNPTITRAEADAAKLAATCCLTLGKSHCASVHTGGDLLLMSLYERGTVPEERQLAQMFHEVPFHTRVIKSDEDPTLIDPGNEIFVMKQMSLPQAEELAKKISTVAGGNLRYEA